MNKRKIEEQIKEQIDVAPNFDTIKNKIDFNKYTKVEKIEKTDNRVTFKFNYWKFATPLAMIVALLVILLQKGPDSSMQKPNGPELENSMVVSSNASNSSSIVNGDAAISSTQIVSNSSSSSSSSVKDEDELDKPGDGTTEDPQGPTTPGENEQVYNEMDGYFYFDQTYNEGVESIQELCFVRYAFNCRESYDQDSYVKVRAYIGVNLINNENISLSFELNGETIYSANNIDETYTFSFFEDDLYKPYISLVKYVEFDIKLTNLINSQGTLDLKVKSLNDTHIDIDNDVIYYFISNDKVVLY